LVDKGCQVSEEIISRIMYLYQTITMRHGVMIVGATLSGKTTTISTLEETLKRSRENEIQELTVMYKQQKAKLMGRKHGRKAKTSRPGQNDQHDEIKLTADDLKIIKAKCKNEGVETFYINPKSITIDQLMGNFDETSHDWVDGILAYLMRECSIDTSNKRKWIVFDGPIDPIWVENLNSVLDDNKKLTLNTGETIKLSPSMNILIEAENLSSCTPATISRCGMLYMQEEQISK
jgi:dynein heavy chain